MSHHRLHFCLGVVSVFALAMISGCPSNASDGDDGGVLLDAASEPDPCLEIVDVTDGGAAFSTLVDFSGSEDFVFDVDGALVSVDPNGNLTKQTIDGEPTLVSPALGETAGIRMLAGGDFVIANVEQGSLMRVTPAGGQSTILSGINYPNGVEVDGRGMVFVAEHDSGQVRMVDPDTGVFNIIADGLFNPNGLSFSPDEETLYIGSFGGGTIHSVSRTADGWAPVELFAQVTEATGQCGDVAGASCISENGLPGVCEDDGGALVCVERDVVIPRCDTVGQACAAQNGLESFCIAENSGALICPGVPRVLIDACDGETEGAPCTIDDAEGGCVQSLPEEGGDFLFCFGAAASVCANLELGAQCNEFGEDGVCIDGSPFGSNVNVCIPNWLVDQEPCADLEVDDRCSSDLGEGVCVNGGEFGVDGTICVPGGFSQESGGLDGLDVDACGNVYVTEFTTGIIYRLPPDGSKTEVFVTLPSGWIPNIHWGKGAGGFEKGTLYVMDRDEGRLFAVETGVEGSPTLAVSP